jgi:diaminopropionate ammonia-lyase
MFLSNPFRSKVARPRSHLMDALGRDGRQKAKAFLTVCPAHQPTPMHVLRSFAKVHGLRMVYVKDESYRMGLNSFKALGGAYAVMTLVLEEAERKLGQTLTPQDVLRDDVREIAKTITVACATDGNHGRSVAAGARVAGCKAVILMHAGVSDARVAAIKSFGAEVIRVNGSYDDSVAEAARLAKSNGWTVVSDTSYAGYESIPLTVMQGYTIMAGEAFNAMSSPPTHVFLQAGVGGLAAAVTAYARDEYGKDMPKIIVVEPERAACLFASASAGRLTKVPHGEPTIMGMLECYEPSQLAWEILAPFAHAFVTLPEDAAPRAMNILAKPMRKDPAIVSGESGCAGFAGLLACLKDAKARRALGLDEKSRVLVINSEGATDPENYKRIIGLAPRETQA